MRTVFTLATVMLLSAPPIPALQAETSPQSLVESQILTPGAIYVSSFPLDERREVCLHLAYDDGTEEFAGCLEGYFPENPAYNAAAI